MPARPATFRFKIEGTVEIDRGNPAALQEFLEALNGAAERFRADYDAKTETVWNVGRKSGAGVKKKT